MKLIVAGATGFVGSEVVAQAIAHKSITSVIALSRRPLSEPPFNHPKVKVVVLEDFEKGYTPEVIEQLKGAEGCCWALGAKSTGGDKTRRVNLNYALSACNAFRTLPLSSPTAKFRLAYTSGIITERDQDKNLWIMSDMRKIGGEAETKLIEYAKEADAFETFILRPGGIRPKEGKMLPDCIVGSFNVRVDEVAATLIDCAVRGDEGGRDTLENADIARRGRELLGRAAEK
ncbi:NAD(P)-binding Rossmann-fold containing protein [Glarea lozoyensis ATCC 20868]|uniref:NAD(P)-binding Rossmann-fold containing protein n=1 Tax=Glarea lozoyensis (strain ATCC 20868 / MF5171) TaxID=1116229 RepID=S3DI62_GLAL2|nr:NAD(P)-binding Rossmann-fold containing protein [Glarea lozoyensis ATCC 20868]EPE26253.1 NAD(P)-binding Rossmann-fold containing protein [Glarea lozoyensis ATCC 20868]